MSDARTRNNTSSKKSYEKALERQYAEDYEHQMIIQHKLTYPNTDAFHWSMTPEELLYNAGYITDFNKHRHERLMRKKERTNGENRVRDYGFDGLAVTHVGDSEIYSGLQAKYYIERQVCANDIGSFLVSQMSLTVKNPRSKGYLYTNSKLQVDLAENIAHPAYPIGHVLFPWKHPDARTVTKCVSVQLECDKLLREDQKDALKQLEDKDGINALNTPCRWGKTIVAGHYLKKINAKLIIAIAPLLVSVDNLKKRLECFLPSYTSLCVDSDTGGTTNVEEIKKFLSADGKHIIYSTFKSALDILAELLTEYKDKFILGDEIHNADIKLCKFVKQFPRGLVMSATLPEEIDELLDINHTIYIPFAQAIKDGIIVDYTLWLPYLTKGSDGKTSVDIEIPLEFSEYDSDLTAKAFYLATVMLKTGSRRCITYLSRQEDCDRFVEVVTQIFEKYHGLTIWTGKIDATISKNIRNNVLNEFENGQNDVYHILTSIRILDEAVDIPRCDSVFITNVGEQSSDIRMTQRSQRSSTKDPKNPSKHNNIILWADGWEKCVGALDILRKADPIFHKKIRIADSNYDKGSDKKRLDEIAKSVEDFKKFEKIQSFTREQMQVSLAKQYVAFYKEHGKTPATNRGKDDDASKLERKLFYARKYWAQSVRIERRGYNIYESVKSLMDAEIPGWSDTLEDRQLILVKKYIHFVTTNNRQPRKVEGERDIYNARKHWLSTVQGTGKHLLYEESKALLDEKLPDWSKDRFDKRQENANKLVEFYQLNKRLPKYVSGEDISELQKEENKIANIYTHLKNCIDDEDYTDIVKFLDEHIPKWSNTFNSRAIRQCEKLIQHHTEHGEFPNDDSECGKFYRLCRTNIIFNENVSPPYDTIAIMLDKCYSDWRLTRQELRQKEQNKIVEQIVQFFHVNRHFPISSLTAENEESVLGHKLILYRQFINGTGDIPISEENQRKLDECSKLWRSGNARVVKTCITNTNRLKEFVRINNRYPKQAGETDEETTLGRMLSKARQTHKKGELLEECKILFEEISEFAW
jgi:superfamily II DNA or RNA helicase